MDTDELEEDQIDIDYEPNMCGWCGKEPPCPPGTHGDSFIYD